MKGQGGDHITSSGIFEVSGSVGIGTSTPSASLDVSGSARFSSASFAIGTSFPYAATYGAGNDGIIQVKDGGSDATGNYKTQMWFRLTGNVGGYNSNYWGRIEQDSIGFKILPGRYQDVYVKNTDLSGTTYLGGSISQGTTAIAIPATTAYVGIGTNNPSALLHISGSTTATSSIARGVNINSTLVAAANSDTLAGLDISPTFTNGAFTGVKNLSLKIGSSYAQYNSTLSHGAELNTNVGIAGTLDVGGDSSIIYLWKSGARANGMYIGSTYLTPSFGHMYFGSGANKLMIIAQSTGNVLINSTTDTGHKLLVTGSGTAGSLNVDGTLYVSGSRVGVGTSTPGSQLEVRGADTSFVKTNSGTFDVGYNTSNRVGLTQNIVGYNSTMGPNGVGGIRLGDGSTYAYLSANGTSLLLNGGGGNVGIGTTTPSASLHISGASSANLLRIDSPASSSIVFVSGSGNVGIGTNAPVTKLYLDGGVFTKKYYTDTSNNTIQFGSAYELFGTLHAAGGYRFFINPTGWLSSWEFAIGNSTNNISFNSTGITTLKVSSTDLDLGGGVVTYYKSSPATGFSFASGNGWDFVLRGTSDEKLRVKGNGNFLLNTTTDLAKLTVKGSGATSATTTFLLQNSTPTNLLTINDIGQVSFTSPTMSLAVSQSAFSISPIISASAVVGGQYYGVNITPTFFQTTGSQTETAFRVAATFTSSNATATGGTNIIADFGSTSAGSQLTVTDVTSGSIYMVNDVSGLPIIEATSDWGVKIYDFPRVVLEKTGSQVNINGTLQVSGSFILPLSQSATPQTGSAYWSGSLLFIYNGTRYMSASFF
jgi:hypothetical protein